MLQIKLSEAIRLGAMLGPQCFSRLFDESGGSCAIGAAIEAVGQANKGRWLPVGRYWNEDDLVFYDAARAHILAYQVPIHWKPVFEAIEQVQCPVGCGREASIPHLNNLHRWTREQIADWVERIENQLFPQPVELVSDQHEAEQLIAALASV
jgi:hypothetical protein